MCVVAQRWPSRVDPAWVPRDSVQFHGCRENRGSAGFAPEDPPYLLFIHHGTCAVQTMPRPDPGTWQTRQCFKLATQTDSSLLSDDRRATNRNRRLIKRDGFLDSFLFLTKFTRLKQHLNWWSKLLSNASTCYLKQIKVCYNIHQIKHIQTPKIYKKSTTTHSSINVPESKLVKISGFIIYFHKHSYNSYAPQLPLATQTYCIRTRQGQHYRRDVACLEQEFNYTLERGRFKSRGDSLVAVLDNTAYTKVILYNKNNKNNNKNNFLFFWIFCLGFANLYIT